MQSTKQGTLQENPQGRAGERSLHLTVAYDGAAYFGWQKQPEQITVQEVLERALTITTGQPNVRTLASSRTDTGVHAIAQSVLFKSTHWPAPADRLPYAVNTKLPPDVTVRKCEEVSPYFHPLRDSTGKRYRYQIYNSRKADPLGRGGHWWIRRRLDLSQMRIAAALIEGQHDFNSFQSTGSPRSSTIRTVRELTIRSSDHMDGRLITIDIEADGFLYNMVRNIVGTLAKVGVGSKQPQWISDIFSASDRRVAGATAPPQGLCLIKVLYD